MMIYTGCFLVCTLYALILATRTGQRFADRHTWATVVLGVAIVLGFVWIQDSEAAQLSATMFIVASVPIISRSLILDFLRSEREIERLIKD